MAVYTRAVFVINKHFVDVEMEISLFICASVFLAVLSVYSTNSLALFSISLCKLDAVCRNSTQIIFRTWRDKNHYAAKSQKAI